MLLLFQLWLLDNIIVTIAAFLSWIIKVIQCIAMCTDILVFYVAHCGSHNMSIQDHMACYF